MENNKKSLNIEKLDKLVFNSKSIDIVMIFMSAIFIFLFIFSGISIENSSKYYENIYNNLRKNIENYNINIINNNVTSSEGINDEIEKPIFDNAITAVHTAFDKYYNYNTVELVCTGVVNTTAAGQDVEIVMYSKYIRYNNGHEFVENIRKETKTNFGQTEATRTLFKDGKRYKCTSSSVSYFNKNLSAIFDDDYDYDDLDLKHHAQLLINKNTIVNEKNFTIKKDSKGRVECYYASVGLSCSLAVKEYAYEIKQSGGTSLPEFSSIEINCVIDPEGNLVAFSTDEKMSANKTVIVSIKADMRNTLSYVLISHDEEPTFPEPNI